MAAVLSPIAVYAQSPVNKGYQPVDPMVGDVDPLHVSLRQLQGGMSTAGQDTRMYRRGGSAKSPATARSDDKLFYVNNGMVAEFERSDYFNINIRKQQFIVQTIPANTVFHLGLPPIDKPAPVKPDSPLMIKSRVDGKINARRSAIMPIENVDQFTDKFQLDQRAYLRFRHIQRMSVLSALDNVASDHAAN